MARRRAQTTEAADYAEGGRSLASGEEDADQTRKTWADGPVISGSSSRDRSKLLGTDVAEPARVLGLQQGLGAFDPLTKAALELFILLARLDVLGDHGADDLDHG